MESEQIEIDLYRKQEIRKSALWTEQVHDADFFVIFFQWAEVICQEKENVVHTIKISLRF